MSFFVQRQYSGFVGDGSSTDPTTYSKQSRLWELQDVYPSKILKLADGLYIANQAQVAGASFQTYAVPLPGSYSSTNRLCFALKTDQNIKVSFTSPDNPASAVIVYAPSGQYGFYSCCQTVTSISIVVPGATAANISYVAYQLPDLSLTGSWRDGYQTVGIVTT